MRAPDTDSLRRDENFDAPALHRLPGANLGALAAFRFSVHRYFALRDDVLALPTAAGNARELEQIAQPHIFLFQLNLDGLHKNFGCDLFDSSPFALKREARPGFGQAN